MKRFTAAVLVVSMAVQASGCATSLPPQSARTVALDAPATPSASRTQVVVADGGAHRTYAAPAPMTAPTIPATEFWGGPAGAIVGVGLLAAMALILSSAGSDRNSRGAGSAGGAAPAGP